MKKTAAKVLCLCVSLAIILSLGACAQTPPPTPSASTNESTPGASTPATDAQTPSATPVSLGTPPGDPASIPDGLAIDWNARYRFSELEAQMDAMVAQYSSIAKKYSIGTSWQERDLWCVELTNPAIEKEKKTGITVFGNIHGGEREGASSAMYTMWWMLLNSEDAYLKTMLDNYIIYIVPVINPDGYEQSFINNNRPNLRPTDRNGDGIAFSDPFTDINGDGYIATLYRGTADVQPDVEKDTRFGMESPDWDKNGKLGDDQRSSTIDMNRTFDHQWNRYDIETVENGVIGNNSWASAGPSPASEPEIQAVQNFVQKTPMNALVTLHTGIQCVLYPWCYRGYDANNPKDAEIPFMKETAAKMAESFAKTTGKGCYTMSSYEDYPTSSEMIDYTFGKFNIHSYTIEVYDPGKSETGDIKDCKWENTLPEPTFVFYDQAQLQSELKLDPATLVDAEGKALAPGEGLWFYTGSTAQMVDKAPEGQDVMVKGAKDAILTMIESEPQGTGYTVPSYLQ